MRKPKVTNSYTEQGKQMHNGIRLFLKQLMKKHRITVSDVARQIQSSEPNTYYLLSERANISAQKLFELINAISDISGKNIRITLNETTDMRYFTTEVDAIDPADGILKTWQGPHVQAISFDDAKQYCNSEGMGYLRVTGILVKEVDEEADETIDYSNDN